MKTRILVAVLALGTLVASQEAATKEPVAAWKGTVRKTVERTGTFVPSAGSELELDLQVYRGNLAILEVLPHGRFVNKGDVIVRVKTKGIDRQIVVDEMSLKRAEMDLRQAEEKVRMEEKKAAASLERTVRDANRAAKRLKEYRDNEKAFDEESERLSVLWREYRLDDQRDELTQLEKMYAEDELVDATEEIVLKRQRRNFARQQALHELSERRRKHRKENYDHWRMEDYEMDARHKAESLERTKRSQAMDRERRENDLAKRRYDLGKTRKRFAELKNDREQFVIRAPHDGLLLHGAIGAAPWTSHLKAGGKVNNRTVFATVAPRGQLKVKTNIEEKTALEIKVGMAAEVEPKATPDKTMLGVLSIDYLPGKGGTFNAEVAFEKVPMELRPAMTGKVIVILGEERDAVLVPNTALIEKDGKTFVKCRKGEEGEFEEREVVTGLSDGTNTSIVEGVSEGEFVAIP